MNRIITAFSGIGRAGTMWWSVVFLIFLSCNKPETKKDGFSVSSVTPSSGPIVGGTTISISGKFLDFVTSVKIDGTSCLSFELRSPELIVCVTPAHAEGTVSVDVTGPTDEVISKTFTYIPPVMSVTSISPAGGTDAGNTLLTVVGQNFETGSTITVGGLDCTSVQFISSTSMKCRTPANVVGSYPVVVTSPGGQTATAATSYTYSLSPTVTLVSPVSGTTGGGTVLTITGTNFVNPTVSLGGTPCVVTAKAATSITCTTGAKSPGAVTLRVVNSNANSVDVLSGYTYIRGPIPQSISPAFGVPGGGTSVTITGGNFKPLATVKIGGVDCTPVTVVSLTQIDCVTGAKAVGTYDVVVTNADGLDDRIVNGYSYRLPPPVVSSVAPSNGPIAGGTSITITGTDFQALATVKIGTVTCTSPVITATTITCTTGASTDGAQTVTVTNPDTLTGSLPSGFAYQAAPTVTAVTPSGGDVLGGTTISVAGTYFRAGATVSVGGVNCGSVIISSETLLTCVTGANAAGLAAITVTNTDGQFGTRAATYKYALPPVVTNILPAAGALGGGTLVTISGTGFVTGASVSVGGVACTTVTVVNATTLTCTTGIHAAGVANVVVTNSDMQASTLAAAYTFQAAPAVTTIAPAYGPIAGATSVTITGTGFLAGATVSIGGAACAVTATTATSISCTTGAGAAGASNVVVTNPDSQTGTLTTGFTYLAAPTISSVSPAFGPLAGGNTITITGTGFFTGVTMTIDSVACTTFTRVSATSLTCVVPAAAAGPVDIVVTNVDLQTVTSSNSYTYTGAPTVTAASPSAGALAGGTSVTLTGTNFFTGATVDFGGSACAVTSLSATSITCTAASHASGAVTVKVTNTDTQNGSAAALYTYQPAPTVSAVSPLYGPIGGGSVLTITGTGFVASATVSVGGTACPVSAVTSTSITCTSPVGTAGAVSVTVTNADTQSGTKASAFTYLNPPTVTAISKSAGALAGGTSIVLTGTGFVTGATVDINGSACAVTATTSTTISCTTSAHAAGTFDVDVTNVDAQVGTLTNGFTYQAAPAVTSVVASAGTLAGGTSVVVNGTGFVTGATVLFDTGSCVVTAVTATTITCLTPAHIAGAVTVKVTNTDLQFGSLATAYTYQAAPTITTVSPAVGSSAGGTTLTITGTGFVAGVTATVGGVSCPVTANTATSITCTSPVHAAGIVNVIVTNVDTQTGTKTNSFTYLDAPTVTSVTPAVGAVGGLKTVTVLGTNFYAGATVSFGGSACAVLSLSATSISCRTSAHAAGAVAVTVTNVDSQFGTLAGGYTYRPAPTVSTVSPAYGPIGGGTTLTITGSDFVSPVSVTVGTAACVVTAESATSITCTTGISPVSGSAAVTVTNPVDLQAGIKTGAFIYLRAPVITSVSPTAGALAGSTTISLVGTNFFPGATVTVGGVACTSVTVVSDTLITCSTPAGSAGAANVVVTNPDAQADTETNGYTYQAAPTVSTISPGSGRLSGGTSVTITGSDFVTGATVKIGGTNCTGVTFVNATTITCTTPAGVAGAQSVEVINADTQSGTAAGLYTYQSAPTVTSVSPNGGPVAGGTVVTVTGTNFLTGASMSFGGTVCTGLTVVSSSSITCTTPAKAAGAYTVTATNIDGQTGSATNAYTFRAAPTISAISPTIGATAGGTVITVTGTGFVTGATVTVGGVACTSVNVSSGTNLTCRTGANAAGSVTATITNSDTQTGTGGTYLYQVAPVVTSVSPTSSALAGGATMTITGSGFMAGATVTIGGTTCTSPTVVSANSITCTIPGKSAGAYSVVVRNTDTQTGTLASAITYRTPPTVTSVSPTMGAIDGGSTLTITGSGFVTGATVLVGSSSCVVGSVTSTSITCVTGSAVAGTYSLTVTNTDAQSGTRASSFTYVNPPTVTSVSLNTGTIAGGKTVTITGTNFYTGSTVDFGGSACTSVTVISTTSISCVTPANAAGAVTVSVISPYGATGSLAAGYTYVTTPALLAFVTGTSSPTPPASDNYGTTSVNITHTFTLKNTGDTVSSNVTMALGGSSPASFAIGTDNCTGLPLAAGATCTVQVTFLGAFVTTGTYSATIGGTAVSGGTATNNLQGRRP